MKKYTPIIIILAILPVIYIFSGNFSNKEKALFSEPKGHHDSIKKDENREKIEIENKKNNTIDSETPLSSRGEKWLFNKKEERIEQEPYISKIKQEFISILSIKPENRNISDLDKLIIKTIKNNKLSRIDKIELFLYLAKSHTKNSSEHKYFIDNLIPLKPFEKTTEIIDEYNLSSNERKKSLLLLLSSSISFDSIGGISEKTLRLMAEKSQEVNAFLKEQVRVENNKELFKEILISYSFSSPSNEFITTIQEIPRERINSLIEKEDYNNIMLDVAFSNKESQASILPQILIEENISTLSFQNKISSIVTSEIGETLPIETKQKIFNAIKDIPIEVKSRDHFSIEDMGAVMNQVKTIISLQNKPNKYKATAEYAINNFMYKEKPFEMATVVNLSDPETFSIFRERKDEIIPFLETELLSNQKLSTSAREMINGAIEALKE